MIDFLQMIAGLLVTSSLVGLLFTFTIVMRGIARREREELADLNDRSMKHG